MRTGLGLRLNVRGAGNRLNRFLLDQNSGAAVAYSLRKLSSSYSGSAVRVLRTSDAQEQDIGFSGGELDTASLLSFVNSELEVYFSDFTSGNEDLAEGNGIGTDGETIDGVSDAYKFELSGGHSLHQALAKVNQLTKEQSYRYEFDYYIPSSNSIANTIKVVSVIPSQNYQAQDEWTSVSFEDVFHADDLIFRITDGIDNYIDADGDVIYLKNIRITQTTSDGLVTTWYDQSGNSNDATQATQASMPKLVDAGSLVTENGKAVIDFDGVDDMLSASISEFNYPFSAFYIFRANPSEENYTIDWSDSSINGLNVCGDSNDYRWMGVNSGTFIDSQSLASLIVSSNSTSYINQIIQHNGISNSGNFVNMINIGSRSDGSINLDGTIQEVILYDSDQSSNRTSIESNINNYYSIY